MCSQNGRRPIDASVEKPRIALKSLRLLQRFGKPLRCREINVALKPLRVAEHGRRLRESPMDKAALAEFKERGFVRHIFPLNSRSLSSSVFPCL